MHRESENPMQHKAPLIHILSNKKSELIDHLISPDDYFPEDKQLES